MTLSFDPLGKQHLATASAFLKGFVHEWNQGGQLIEGLESGDLREFAATFAPALAKYYERQTLDELEAKRLTSCLAVGVAAAVQAYLEQQTPPQEGG